MNTLCRLDRTAEVLLPGLSSFQLCQPAFIVAVHLDPRVRTCSAEDGLAMHESEGLDVGSLDFKAAEEVILKDHLIAFKICLEIVLQGDPTHSRCHEAILMKPGGLPKAEGDLHVQLF